jgi:hypothetical protein
MKFLFALPDQPKLIPTMAKPILISTHGQATSNGTELVFRNVVTNKKVKGVKV